MAVKILMCYSVQSYENVLYKLHNISLQPKTFILHVKQVFVSNNLFPNQDPEIKNTAIDNSRWIDSEIERVGDTSNDKSGDSFKVR